MGFADAWAAAKGNFKAATGKKKPTEKTMGLFRKGTGVQPALKAVDAAQAEDQLHLALAKFMLAKKKYQELLAKKIEKADAVNMKTEIRKLSDALHQIERAIQIHRNKRSLPLTATMSYGKHVVVDFGMVQSEFTTKWLDVSTTRIRVEIDIDKKLLALAKKGKEGVRLADMSAAANGVLAEFRKRAAATVMILDKKIMKATPAERITMVREANETLAIYAKRAGNAALAAVNAYWAEHKKEGRIRKMYLIKGIVKIVAGVIGIAANAVRLVISMGTDVTAYIALAKTMQVTAKQISTFAKSIDSASDQLAGTCNGLLKTMADGLSASNKQTLAELFEVGDFGGNFRKTGRAGRQQVETLIAKVQKIDTETDTLVGKLNSSLDKIKAWDKAAINPEIAAQYNAARAQNTKIIDQIGVIQQEVKAQKRLLNWAKEILDSFDAKQSPLGRGFVNKSGVGVQCAALGSLVKGCLTIGGAMKMAVA